MTKCLIDGDICVYRVGFASQEKGPDGNPVPILVEFACARMDRMIEDICKANNTDQYVVYLTSEDKSNFRHEIYPEYKANRKSPKPLLYKELRAYLIADHKAEVIFGREADDAMADAQNEGTVICSIDKDLDQVVGRHYDFVKDVAYEVDKERAVRFFYFQLLTGDRTDNIPGIEGIGAAKAEKVLAGIGGSEPEMLRAVRSQYERKYGKKGDEMMLMNGRLLKIGGGLWEIPEVHEAKDSEATLNDTLIES